MPAPRILELLLSPCATTRPEWVAPIRPGSSVNKAFFHGLAYAEGRFADSHGLLRDGKRVVPPDYRHIHQVDAQNRLDPDHKEIATGTLRQIPLEAGLEVAEFVGLLH